MQEPASPQWFVMRDLKRPNAKNPAYKFLEGRVAKVFTPLNRFPKARGEWEEKPVVHGLLFVYETREVMDPILEQMPTLQYRYLPRRYREPMVVPTEDMERFIYAINVTQSPCYYTPEEITPKMHGRRIRVVGGTLDGYEGRLITVRGSKVKRLLVELPGFLAAGVEVDPDYIQFLD